MDHRVRVEPDVLVEALDVVVALVTLFTSA